MLTFKRGVVRDASLLTSATMLSSAISGLLGLLVARLLAPELFGIWQTMRLVQQYANYANLGVPWSMQRDIARDGDRNPREAAASFEIGFTFVSLTSLGLAALLVLASLLLGWPFKPAWTVPLALFLVAVQAYTALVMALAGRRRFLIVGVTDVVTSVANLVLTVALALLYGLTGLLYAQLAWALLGVAIGVGRGHLRPRFRLALGRVGAQIRLGLAFTINGFLYLLTKSVDRILILLLLGTSALGYYGVALLAMSYVELVGTAVGRVVFPHIVGRFEQRRELADIRHYVVRASIALGAAGAFCGGLGALLLPAAVTIVLPRYASSVAPAQILVLAGAYLVIRSTVEYFFVAVSKLPRTFPIQLVVTALALGAGFIVLRAGLGLVGIAATMLAAYLATSAGFTGYAFAHYDRGAARLFGFLARVHAPSLYAGGVVLVLERVLPVSQTLSTHGAALLLAQLLIFAVAYAPWLVTVEGGRRLLPVRLPQ